MGNRKRALRLFGLLAVMTVATITGLFAPLDRVLVQERFRTADLSASGDTVFVAIDKASLDRVGVWPWPRSVHAEIVDKVIAAGAATVVLDIDFSTPSTPENDAALEASLERAAGSVILPVFRQNPNAADRTSTVITRPIQQLADNAWLGTVNVEAERDGHVWNFPAGAMIDDEWMASIPVQISRSASASAYPVRIDFGIDPATVPVISVADLLAGTVPAEMLSGKTAVIGAFATELRDVYAVPAHGIIPGALVQIMATETLDAERNLAASPAVLPLLFAAALLFLMHVFTGWRTRKFLVAAAALAIAIEAVAYVAYWNFAVILPTGAALIMIAATSALHMLAYTDILNRIAGLARIETSNTRQILETVFRKSFDSVLVLDADGRILEASDSANALFGVNLKAIDTGTFVRILPHRLLSDAKAALGDFKAGLDNAARSAKVFFMDAGGNERTIEYVITPSMMAAGSERAESVFINTLTLRDVTDSETQQKRINFMSRHDELTDALRRPAFVDVLAEQMEITHNVGLKLCVVATSIPRFNAINMALGRDSGEALLKAFHDRVTSFQPEPFATCRIGGENFAFAIWLPDDMETHLFAETAITRLSSPYRLEKSQANVKVQIGIAAHDRESADSAQTAKELLGHAETALDCAREQSGKAFVEFSRGVGERLSRNKIIEQDLWDALIDDDFRLFYQPQVELGSGKIIGFEALIRWQHPELGLLTPGDFMSIAQTNGFIAHMGVWVMRKACQDAMAWPEHVVLSINVSPEQFEASDLVPNIAGALRASGLPPHRLLVEVLETSYIQDTKMVLEKINELRAMGVLIALDDFGTGNASLDYLMRFPFDKIKVDRMFARDVGLSQTKQAVIRSIKVLSEAFDIKMLCEGIETDEDRKLIALLGCDEAQGYLFGRPMELEKTFALFDDDSETRAAAS